MEMTAALILWGILLITAVAAEFGTQQLVSIWFAAGALGALLTAAFGGPMWLQLIVFTAVSLLLLIFTRPILRKVLSFPVKETNVKMDVGKLAVVMQEINPVTGTGRARLNDAEWMAVSSDGSIIPAGTTVRVDDIDGAKLYVTPALQKENASIY